MDRREQERPDRVPGAGSFTPRRKRDPRRSERRFAGDASREQAGQDKKQPDDEDRRGDHCPAFSGSAGGGGETGGRRHRRLAEFGRLRLPATERGRDQQDPDRQDEAGHRKLPL